MTSTRLFAILMPAGTRPALTAVAALLLAGPSVHAAGPLDHWYLRHDPELMVGYDTNVYGSNSDTVDDGFTTATYRITTGRKQSLTKLDLTGAVESTWFFSEQDANAVDGSVQLDFAYPRDHEEGSYWEGQGFWRTDTDVERTLRDRIRRNSYGGNVLGEWAASPKLLISGGADARVTDRSDAGYSTNRVAAFSFGVGHSWIPERRWFLEYTYELGEAEPAQGQSTDSESHIVGLRVRGRLLPKVTGTAFLGYEHSSFTGRQELSDGGFSGSADVRWESSALLTMRLSGRRQTEFSPSGAVTRRSIVTLTLERHFGPAFTLLADVSPEVLDYDREDDRKDRILTAGVGLRYRRTSRFYVEANVDWGTIDSSLPDSDADQTIASVRSGIQF